MSGGPPDDDDAKALDKLATVSDALSANAKWSEFLELQDNLVEIRLAARFETDGPLGSCESTTCREQRQLQALREFPKLYSDDSTGVQKVVLSR